MKISVAFFLCLPIAVPAQVVLKTADSTIYFTRPYDIVINEIMADPDPPVGLPVAEYIELLNASDTDIVATGWSLAIGDKKIRLPSFRLGKKDCIIVCKARDSLLLGPYGTVLPVNSLPALNNGGQTLILSDMADLVIHSVSYTDKWYGDSYKSEGGWSLEMIDTDNPCGNQNNWSASNHSLGGTPGSVNSVKRHNPDHISPALFRASSASDSTLLVLFSEPLLGTSISDPYIYSVDHGIYHPILAEPIPPEFSSVFLTFPVRFSPTYTYELTVRNSIRDCAGNHLPDSYTEFGLAFPPDSFDLVINEVLFDAHEEEEFIEITNRSDRIIELSSLILVLLDEYSGKIIRRLHAFDTYFQLLPGWFAVITGDASGLQSHYTCRESAVTETEQLLNLPDEEGTIALMRNSLRQIDCFHYEGAFHFEPITDPEGISLERIRADYPTNDPNNWHSAAEDAGFATPGYENSQTGHADPSAVASVWTEPEVFTPDNDGNDDFLSVFYRFTDPGSLATVLIFNSRGRMVRLLANNEWLGAEGCLTWDGTNAQGEVERPGIYVICTEILSAKGLVTKYTGTCVLSKEL